MDQSQANRLANELLNTTVGGWDLVDICNSGKSAVVLKGKKSGEVAAVKIFDPELIDRFGADRQSARIERELSLRGKEHPNLVKIIDGGLCEKTQYWFLVMEYIDAPNLAEVLDTLPRKYIRKVISQIAGAAQFLEELQLAHRDIKPDNIAIYPDFERSVLLDLGVIRPFGLSEMTDEDQVTFVGTLQYSSPEFLMRDEIDTMDGWRGVTFYQLGAVLHDMIMRKRIFSEFVNPYARLVKAIENEIPNIESTEVSADLILLAKNCLQKVPELRLRFVDWKDFQKLEQSSETGAGAKDRIRRRFGLSQEQSAGKTEADSERLARNERRIVGGIRTRLEDLVREEFIPSEFFMPIEINEFAEDQPKKLGFLVFIKAAAQLGLSYSVSLVFYVELLDAQSEAVALSFAAAISDVRLERESMLSGPRTTFFEGVFEESVMRTHVENLLYPALDQAQQTDRNTSGLIGSSLTWLTIELGDEHE